MPFSNCILSMHDTRTKYGQIHVGIGVDREFHEAGAGYGEAVADIWGGQQRLASYPLEEPIIQSQATPRASWLSNAWYRDVLLPRRLHDCVTVFLARDSHTLGAIAFGVHEDQGEVSDDTVSALRLLAPHLRRAVIIGGLFEQKAATAATFSEVIDGVSAGVVLVDEHAEILHSNASADAMLKAGNPISDMNGRLGTPNSMTSDVLDEAIRQSSRGDADLERRSINIPARHADGTPTAIQVMPLRCRSPQGRAAAAVFVANSADPPRLPGDALSLLYKLTPAEVRVFELIVEGRTPAEIAALLALRLATVRTHLSRVFEKTGVRTSSRSCRLSVQPDIACLTMSSTPAISNERLSEIIGSIYDCVLAPETWPAALANIVGELGFATCVLSMHDRNGKAAAFATAGMEPHWLELSLRHAASMPELWGGPGKMLQAPLEEPVLQSDATPRSMWRANAYYEAVLRPMGIHDIAVLSLLRDSEALGLAGFGQREGDGEVDERVKDGLRLFAPHLRRAVTIGRLFEQHTIAITTFSEVLEGIAAGAVLVDEALSIVHANATARKMLSNSDPILARGGRLQLAAALPNAVLGDAVRQAARNEVTMERRSIDIPLRRRDGSPAVVQVLPLLRRSIGRSIEQRTVAAAFISNAADPPRLPADAMALLYDLTPAEARVFELIVEGKTPAAISEQLGVTLATVRTHLGRVFDKTGCSRQADLVAMASKVTLTI
ncbi:MAG: LuxR C-terminal-related transcriptional regulator [Hyphomicrobium sp.]